MDARNRAAARSVTYIKLTTDVLQRRDLSSTAKLVYAVLADRIGHNGSCWPGQRRLAADCGVNVKAAHRAIDELATAGLIMRERGRLSGPRSGRTCKYRLASVPESAAANVPEAGTSETTNVRESHTLNVPDSQTLAKAERSRNGHSNVPGSQTKPTKGTKPKSVSMRGAQDVALPLLLNTPEFRAAWQDWQTYRHEARKPLTPSTAKAQLGKLEKMGHEQSIAAIRRSIEHGWAGLFAEDDRRTAVGPRGRTGRPVGHYEEPISVREYGG